MEGFSFKYHNGFFKFQPQKHLNEAFLFPNLMIFIFALNLPFEKSEVTSNITSVLQILLQNSITNIISVFFNKFQPENTQIWQFWLRLLFHFTELI